MLWCRGASFLILTRLIRLFIIKALLQVRLENRAKMQRILFSKVSDAVFKAYEYEEKSADDSARFSCQLHLRLRRSARLCCKSKTCGEWSPWDVWKQMFFKHDGKRQPLKAKAPEIPQEIFAAAANIASGLACLFWKSTDYTCSLGHSPSTAPRTSRAGLTSTQINRCKITGLGSIRRQKWICSILPSAKRYTVTTLCALHLVAASGVWFCVNPQKQSLCKQSRALAL